MRRILVAGAALTLLASAGCGEPAPRGGSGPPGASGAPAASGSAGPSVVTVTATVTGGKVRTARTRVKVPRGATVEITVTGDRADEFHLHGYDREMALTPGRPATMRLTADTPGVFEAELHRSGARVFELQVG
ncbi:hypothetical protein E1281_34875 [Actinomadura sp. KC345]|uniref:hypothetical protein n=1 Tax=Actinomadura sp. KC345 TaxID=2530371 RepID=UPI001043B3C8|nr:hypothetical protein [Actinomadura sp. KC345]TDC43754.1 hypothetical protein E1281_34875 [Actinomadura sp. KC345]